MAYGDSTGTGGGGYGSNVPLPSAAQPTSGGGGGWGWLNPLHDIHNVYNYLNPIGGVIKLGEGAAQMFGAPLVHDVMALGDLGAAGLSAAASSVGWHQNISGNEYLQRAHGEAVQTLQGLANIPIGLGQIGEGIGADVAHLTPARNEYDKLFQFINRNAASLPLSAETRASLLGPDGKGAKPQDIEALAKHQGLIPGLIMQAAVAAPLGAAIEGYAGAAAEGASVAAADPATTGATIGAGDAAMEAGKTTFDYSNPLRSAAKMAGEAKDFTDLAPEDAAKQAERYQRLADIGRNIHHPWAYLGRQVAGFFQANKEAAFPPGAPVPPPTVPENVTPEQMAMAVASQDPATAAAESMAANDTATYSSNPGIQSAVEEMLRSQGAQAGGENAPPPEPGMTRLYNGGGGDRTMWTSDITRAQDYVNTPGFGQGAIRHIDVPDAVAEQMKATAETPRDAAARAAGHQPNTASDYYLTPQELDRFQSVEHSAESSQPTPYVIGEGEPKPGPKLNVQEKPGFTPSGKEDALAELERLHQEAAAQHPTPEAVDAVGRKVAMPAPAWAVRLADSLPPSINRAIGHLAGSGLDRARFNEAKLVFSHAMETAQNAARTSPLMMAGRQAAVDVLTNTDLGISREDAFRYVGEDVAAKATGQILAANFVNNEGWNPLETSVGTAPGEMSRVLPPIAADVRAQLLNTARGGYEGLPDLVRNQLTPDQQVQYDQHIQAAYEGYKQAIDTTMTALLASRFGAHGFESALIDPNEPIMSPKDIADYRRLMNDLRRAEVYRSRQPGLIESARAAYIRQVALGETQTGLLAKAQAVLGVTLQTISDLHQGVPTGIKPENIDTTVQTTLDAAARNEQTSGIYGSTIDPATGKEVVRKSSYSVGVAPQFDVPLPEWNVNAASILKDAILHPKTADGSGTYDPSTMWGGVDSHIGLWKYTDINGEQRVAGDISMDTIGGKPMNQLQARVIGETFQQQAIFDHGSQQDIRLSNDPNFQNLNANYYDMVRDPKSDLNRFYEEQLKVIRTVDAKASENDTAVAVQALMHMDYAFHDVNPQSYKLGDFFRNAEVKAAFAAPRSPALMETTMPFDMTTARGLDEALARYPVEAIRKYLDWYPQSHDFVEENWRGKPWPFAPRDSADVFYDALAVLSVMASPKQNLGRGLMAFANMEDLLQEQKDSVAAVHSIMNRAMQLPPDVTYVQNVGKGVSGEPYFGTETLPGETAQHVVTRGHGTPISSRWFETPELRKLTQSTSMTTGPKYALLDVLFGRLNLETATNEDIANQAAQWTGTPKNLSDANLPPGRIRYWAQQLGIQSPALDHLTELEQQVRDLQAHRERPVAPEGVSKFVSDQAKAYAKEQGLPTPRSTDLNATANPVRGRVVADFYAKAESNPNDPAVVHSYNAFANEVIDQWEFLKKQGINVEFVDRGPEGGAYPDAAAMIADVQNNHHLFVDRTGPGEEHLMPEMNAVVDHTADGTPITTNDAFRAVHDYFGHAQASNTFDRNGEDIAWRLHRQMFSKEAQPALFTETVGQNSYLNFHPSNYARRAAGLSAEFPEQKAILFPDKMAQPRYLPTITEAKQALRDTMRDPSLKQAYEQAMMEHGGQASWAKIRSFADNLRNPDTSLSVTNDSVMAQFHGMRATDWNLKRYPGASQPPEAGSVWADKADELRAQVAGMRARLGDPSIMPNSLQALLWVYTKERLGTEDWGRLLAHNDNAHDNIDTMEQTVRSGGSIDASTFHPLADWWDEELSNGRAYSQLQDEKARLQDLQKQGERLTPQEQARLDELGTIEPRNMRTVRYDANVNARASIADASQRILQDHIRYEIADATEYRQMEASHAAFLKEVEKPIQDALAAGDFNKARSILDEYVAGWENPIKGDSTGGNFRDVARESMASKNDSTRTAVERLQLARTIPKPTGEDLAIGQVNDAYNSTIRGAVSVDPGPTGRLMMRLYHTADIGTLLHEGAHLARLMAPGDVVAELSRVYPHLQDATLTAARVADEEAFVGHFLTFTRTHEAPPGLQGLFDSIARTMDKTYGPTLGMRSGEAVPQDIVNFWDRIFNPQVVRPDKITDPMSAQSVNRPGGANPVRGYWESESQFATRARQLGEQRVQSATDSGRVRAAAATLGKINDAADRMLQALDLGGEAGIANLAKADKLETNAVAGLDKLAETLQNAEGKQVPRLWRDVLKSFQGIAEVAKMDPTGQLAEHLGEIPDNLAKVMRYAAERGFDPTYVPDITWQMAAKHLFNHLNLSTSLEEAGLRKENTGVLNRLGVADRSLEALASAQVVAMKELYQDQLVQHIEKFYAQPHTPGEALPKGWVAWDAVRQGIILGRTRAGDITSVNATSIVPEGVDTAIKAMSRDYSSWPFRFLFKGGPTSVWKNILMTYSPGWYVKHFTGTTMLAAAEGVTLSDFMKAFRMASAKDAFGFHWADVPDEIKGRSIYTEMGDELHKPGSSAIVPLRDIARNEGLREAARQVQFKLRNIVNTVDAWGRTAVYVKTLRESGSPEFAAERAFKATGDFTDMGPFERGVVSAIIPFYAFQKAMFKILVKLPLDHPLAAGLFMNTAMIHDAYMESLLGGPMPDQLIGSGFFNGQLTSIAKINPLTDAYKLITPDGLAQSAHPLIQLLIQQEFGAPTFNSSARMGSYGQLQQQPDWFKSITDTFANSPLGVGTGGITSGDLASLGEALVPRLGRTWSQTQYEQLIKRIQKTQAALAKLQQPGAYVSQPDVVVPAASPGGSAGGGYGR